MSVEKKSKRSPWYLLILLAVVIALAYINIGTYNKSRSKANEIKAQSALIIEQQLILNQKDVINTNWLRTLNPLVENVEGRIVWSNTLQKGIMEFIGLPEIDKNQSYQLWIYDLEEKNSKPIFSDEFSKVSDDALLIPFSAEMNITSPFKFELLLKTEGVDESEPLFLAQP